MNKQQSRFRYPGAQPFTTQQEQIFFGRTKDVEALYERIKLENLVVLYSKSGLGKSSLINAGLIPKIGIKDDFKPFSIRFGAYIKEQNTTPQKATFQQLEFISKETPYLDKLILNDNSLWYLIKNRQLHEKNSKGFLLIFDQFEELFTYPDEEILKFKKELKEILNNQIPQRFRKALEKQFEDDNLKLSDEELEIFHKDVELKVLLAIRSDRMSLLDGLKDYLPNILRHCYKLDALSVQQAKDAILNPAYKQDKAFISPNFNYESKALDAILQFLTKEYTQNVESFQLQILCQNIEKKVIEEDLHQVTIANIGDIESIYKNHYNNQIKSIGLREEQLTARRLVEEGLIFEKDERRLSLYEGQIKQQFGVSDKILKRLIDSHIVRREKSAKGGYIYELSHDSLVNPILKAKAIRIEEEKAVKLKFEKQRREKEVWAAKQKAQEEQRLRINSQLSEKKAKQRTKLVIIISIIGFFFILLTGKFYLQNLNAKKENLENKAALEKQQDSLNLAKKRLEEIEKLVKKNRTKFEENKDFEYQVNALKNQPLIRFISPRADILKVQEEPDMIFYRFKLWLDVPSLRKKEIKSVVYYFDHSSFEALGKERRGKSALENFSREYIGWSCIPDVQIWIEQNNGITDTINFDLCKAVLHMMKE